MAEAADWRNRVRSRALMLFDEGANCAEAVLRAFLEAYHLDPALYRLATGLGAGIGARRDLCGLLTGSVMVLGLLNARGEPNEVQRKRAVYGPAGRVYDWFAARDGVHCTDVTREQPFRGHTASCRQTLVGALRLVAELVAPPE